MGLAALMLGACSPKAEENKTEENSILLRFHDGKFRIAQFTDFHWGDDDPEGVERRINLVKTIVAREKPDLIVLTGDVVTEGDSKTGWQQVMDLFEEIGLPYAVTMGNHDAECTEGIKGDSIFSWLQQSPLCVNAFYDKGVYGYGYKTLPLLHSDNDSTAALVYCIDSNDYPQDPLIRKKSYYDFIHRDQIDWYRQQSEKFTQQNGGTPLPAVAFYHICVPEFWEVARDPNKYGRFLEHCCPSNINLGFFGQSLLCGDIMAMFVGHDHGDDYIGIYQGIALAYGRQSGVEGYDYEVKEGARIIDLVEGKREFSTYTCDIDGCAGTYYYPSGTNSEMKDNGNPALDIQPGENGVKYVYYEGTDQTSTEAMLTTGTKKGEGVFNNFDISQAAVEDYFGYSFDTYIQIPEDDCYRFTLGSDDGSALYVDDKLLIDIPGNETLHRYIGLKKGFHHLHVNYYEEYCGQHLRLFIGTRTMPDTPIPDEWLFLKK